MPESLRPQLEQEMAEIKTMTAEFDAAFDRQDIETAQALRTQIDQRMAGLREKLVEPSHEKALQISQQAYDELFEGTEFASFNFREAYVKGEVDRLSPEQEKEASEAKEGNQENEGYTFQFIFPGHIPRERFLEIFNQKYAQKFNSSGQKGIYYSSEAQQDLNGTQAAQNPNTRGRMMAIRPQPNTIEAHQDTINKNLSAQEAHLQELQSKNSVLNLQGLDLPEYLFADACMFQQTDKHLDENGWSYLLKEKNLQSGRALLARWSPGLRQVFVVALAGAGDFLGARLAVVSHPSA